MTTLLWNQPAQKTYASGVDRGVIYVDGGSGVAWGGLISVAESREGGDVNPYYFDGVKHVNVPSPSAYKATITAFSAPQEFGACVGEHGIVPGFVITRQRRVRFGFSYRTLVGDGLGYRLHLIYNATATPASKTYTTMSDSAFAETRSWSIAAVPERTQWGFPSAHFIIESWKINPAILLHLEKTLYGTNTQSARLPLFDELLDIITYWEPLLITPHSLTGLNTLSTPGGDLTTTQHIGVFRKQATTRLVETGVSGLYQLEA